MKAVRAAVALAAVAASAAVVVSTPVAAQEAFGVSAVHFIVDVSGSMADPDGAGKVKINGAQEALIAMVGSLSASVKVGLRTYPTDDNCAVEGAPAVDFFDSRETFGARVRRLSPNGGTPTAAALRAGADDLAAAGMAQRAVIVLVSDGESNCDEDPCEAARKLRTEYEIDVTVNTIGFRISEFGRTELNCIADAGGGEYRDAENADELAAHLQELGAASMALDVTAPSTFIRSVGLGEGGSGQQPSVQIRAVIRNSSPNMLGNVRASIAVTSDQRPFILRPVRSIGNLDGHGSEQVEWSFTPPLDFADVDVDLSVTVTALNAPTVTKETKVGLRGSILLEDAGEILQGRDHVVILGDSYSSGEGAGYDGGPYLDGTDTNDNPCHKHTRTYGSDLWPGRKRTIIACSGAVAKNLWHKQYPTVPAQIEQLRAVEQDNPPDLVLMTLGGNDVKFADVLKACIITSPGGCNDLTVVTDAKCGTPGATAPDPNAPDECFLELGQLSDVHDELMSALVGQLTEAYMAIDDVVNATGEPIPIIVLAYPGPVPAGPRFKEVVDTCDARLSLNAAEWEYAVEFHQRLNATVETAVERAQSQGIPIFFADEVAEAFEPSHTVCDTDPYLNSFASGDFAASVGIKFIRAVARGLFPAAGGRWSVSTELKYKESFHPNSRGYQAMTAALVEWSRERNLEVVRTRGDGYTVDGTSVTFTPIEIGAGSLIQLQAGGITEVTFTGLAPMSSAVPLMQSALGVVGAGYVDENGIAHVSIDLPANFPTGDHTLYIHGEGPDGEPVSLSWPVKVAVEVTVWERWSPIGGAAAAGVSLLAVLVMLFARALDRRSQRRAEVATA